MTPTDFQFDPIEPVIADIREGRMAIVTDDEDRENEGDLVCAAQLGDCAARRISWPSTRGGRSAPRSTEEQGPRPGVARHGRAQPRGFLHCLHGERGRSQRRDHGHQRAGPRVDGQYPGQSKCSRC